MKNKGFSLVELIAAIAILVLVGVVIAGFISVSSKTYKNTSSEVNIQYEAQQTVNQIKEMIIDANRGVSYGLNASSGCYELLIYNETQTVSGGAPTFIFPVTKITYNATTKQLYYGKTTFNTYSSISADLISADNLLSQYVDSFDVDLSKIANNEVILDIDFTSETREYKTKPTISMRNKVIASNSISQIYANSRVERLSYITSVKITKGNVEIEADMLNKGTTMTYGVNVVAVGLGKDVIWTLEGSQDAFGNPVSTVSNGTVMVSGSEMSTELIIRATSVADSTKGASLTISVPPYDTTKGYITSLALEGSDGTNMTPFEEDIQYVPTLGSRKTYHFNAMCAFLNEDKLSEYDKGVTWSYTVNKGSSSNTDFMSGFSFDSSSGKITCDYRTAGCRFQITATSRAKDTTDNYKVASSAWITVDALTEPGGQVITEPQIEWNAVDSKLSRNTSYDLSITVQNMTVTKTEWDIQYTSGFDDYDRVLDWGYYGYYYPNDTSNVTLSSSNSDLLQRLLKLDCNLEWESSFSFKVTCKITGNCSGETKTIEAERIFTVEPVQIILEKVSTGAIKKNQTTKTFRYTVNNITLNDVVKANLRADAYCYDWFWKNRDRVSASLISTSSGSIEYTWDQWDNYDEVYLVLFLSEYGQNDRVDSNEISWEIQ